MQGRGILRDAAGCCTYVGWGRKNYSLDRFKVARFTSDAYRIGMKSTFLLIAFITLLVGPSNGMTIYISPVDLGNAPNLIKLEFSGGGTWEGAYSSSSLIRGRTGWSGDFVTGIDSNDVSNEAWTIPLIGEVVVQQDVGEDFKIVGVMIDDDTLGDTGPDELSFNDDFRLKAEEGVDATSLQVGADYQISGTAVIDLSDYSANASFHNFNIGRYTNEFETAEPNLRTTLIELVIVPEPSSYALLLGGLALGLVTLCRR